MGEDRPAATPLTPDTTLNLLLRRVMGFGIMDGVFRKIEKRLGERRESEGLGKGWEEGEIEMGVVIF